MEPSLFVAYVTKFFSGVVTGIVEKINGDKQTQPYWFQRMLRKEFSVDGTWKAITGENSQVMADIVAMDSSLPLKKRDSIAKASGDIPKIGMEMTLNEKQLTDLEVLNAQQGQEQNLLKKLFADTPKVIKGVYDRCEQIFLESLSTGAVAIDDTENVGTGVRMAYSNFTKFGALGVVWSNVAAKPFDDLQRMVDAAEAKGDVISRILMDSTAFNNMVKTTQVKEQYAYFLFGSVGQNAVTPTLTQLNQVLTEKFGFTIEIVKRSLRYEKNGVQTAFKPWADGAVAGLTDELVGVLVYARLAEESHPVAGVAYEKADEYILVSKFRTNRPALAEFTNSQARVVPVIASNVYLLDSKTVQA